MSDDLVLSSPTVRFMPTATEAERVWKLAQTVANTDFVPRTLRGNVPAITAAMLTGREIGIGPMHSLRGIDVIDGKPSLSAELMASLVFRAGHTMWIIESTSELCTVGGRRSDWPDRVPDYDLTWSMDDARQAGLDGKNNWKKYPRAMLRSRAVSELCRSIFPDVVERVGYVAEELGGEPQPHAEAVEVVREVAGDDAAVEVAELLDDHEDAPGSVPDDDRKEDVTSAGGGDTPADHPYDWQEHAAELRITKADALKRVREAWPHDDQAARPNKFGDLTELVASEREVAGQFASDFVRDAIEGKEAVDE